MAFDAGFGRVFPAPYRILVTSGWGQPRRGHPHWGMDIRAQIGTPLLAAGDGTVITAKTSNPDGDAGNYIAIRHPSGLVSRYMHLDQVFVKKGQFVYRGALIGKTGKTGIFHSAAHLHFDLLAPTALVPAIIATTGRPTIGWPSAQMEGLGHFVPAEPHLPVDEYQDDVLAYAKKYKVPLYAEVPHGGAGVLVALATMGIAGLSAYLIWTRLVAPALAR